MDYILLSALAPLLVASVFVSYDIACQYKLNFEERVVDLPSQLQLPQEVDIGWGIPKCHCPMHKLPCQAPHSLNFKPGVGRTDGEGIERSWSELNRVANSTKEMGPGSRHDTLDDHLGHHNFRKYVGLGMVFLRYVLPHVTDPLWFTGRSLHSLLVLATSEQKWQQKILDEFTESLRAQPGLEKEWTDMVLAWEKDPTRKNPYVSLVSRKSVRCIGTAKTNDSSQMPHRMKSRSNSSKRRSVRYKQACRRSMPRAPQHSFPWGYSSKTHSKPNGFFICLVAHSLNYQTANCVGCKMSTRTHDYPG